APPRGDDRVIVVVNLDPDNTVEGTVYTDLGALGLPADARLVAHDELTDTVFDWNAAHYVRLWPAQPAHILTISWA
ncbi:MAG: alpha-1,4-glucan--maltose-1-phosphate maltosyltransferase, partial [Propionibacterium sp.]|nr:alpha-1,4-glucan--maltose-1-phosphate maltosyltransferase [Propionibacterium sp.]